ncbi:Catalase [Orchesella cincta]|uniref:Catalase n=1 Tax=Orchesella cincta TaxID=48709 RepID=A0A1D2MCI7_ORCCI|nr:Catalase [Orchesella cincta]
MSRSRKRNPKTHLKSQDMWWDFVSLRPETTFHTLLLFSDIGRAHGYRRMNGSSVHAYKMVNSQGEVVYGKIHWKTEQPAPPMTFQEAKDLLGPQPDYFTQDLYDSIENKNFPSWILYFQVMTVEEINAYPRNPFDITRNWRVEDYPLIEVGRFTLDRNPVNFFAEVEQVGMNVANLVPGIEPSPDRMLHGRMFGYADAIIYRQGTNWPQIPINRPAPGVEINSYQRDGAACYGDNGGGAPNYYPNSFGGHVPSQAAEHVSFSVEGVVDRFDVPEGDDEFIEARMWLERDMGPEERRRTAEAIADRLKDAREEIRERVFKNNWEPIDQQFADQIRREVEVALRNAANNNNNSSLRKMKGKK